MGELVWEPEYYQNFRCSASQCAHTCCRSDWRIGMDKGEYQKIKAAHLSKDLKELVRVSVKRGKEGDDAYAYFGQEGELCPFTDEQSLCRLQLEGGLELLPINCRLFPRQHYKLSGTGVYHRSCSVACGEVVRVLLHSPEGLRFVSRELSAPPKRAFDFSKLEARRPVLTYFASIQALLIDILTNRAYSVDERMIVLGMALQGLEQLELAGKTDQLPLWVAQKKKELAQGDALKASLASIQPNYMAAFLNSMQLFFQGQEVLSQVSLQTVRDRFRLVSEGDQVLGDIKAYRRARAALDEVLDSVFWENYLVHICFEDAFPFSRLSIWENYLCLCSMYSFIKFMAAGSLDPDSSEQDILRVISAYSRNFLYNARFRKVIVEQLQAFESNTLAHMALLVKG